MDSPPSVFEIPGLFRLNLVIVELPTDRYAMNERGGKEYLTRKVAFYLQLDVVVRSPALTTDGSISDSSTPMEGYIVPAKDLVIDGVQIWTLPTLPPELKTGTKVRATVNGIEGILSFEELVQDGFLPSFQAGFGDRVACFFSQRARGNDGF